MLHVGSWLDGKNKFRKNGNGSTEANDSLAFATTGEEDKNDNQKKLLHATIVDQWSIT